MRSAIALTLLILVLALSLTKIGGIAPKIYLPEQYPKITADKLALYGRSLVAHDLKEGRIVIIDPETGGSRSFPAPENIRDMTVAGKYLAIAPTGARIIKVYDLETGETEKIRVPGEVCDLESEGGLIWAAIPDEGLILGLNATTLEAELKVEAKTTCSPNSISAQGKILWIISHDRKTLTRIDLETGQRRSGGIGAETRAIRAYQGGAIVATSEDEIVKVSQNLQVEKKWSLEKASSIDIELYTLPDGRIIYVSLSRWVVGEIEGEKVSEIKVEGRIGGAAVAQDRVWFTEPSTQRIGYVPLSRPPKIEDFKVERLGLDSFKVSAKATDSDGDLSRVLLFTFYSEIIGPEQNQSVEMEPSGDDLYTATITLKRQKAEIYAVALDKFNNTARSEKVKVEIQRIQTVSTTQTTTQAQGSSLDIYMVGSSLTLLIPILIALFYFKLKPKKRRKRRK